MVPRASISQLTSSTHPRQGNISPSERWLTSSSMSPYAAASRGFLSFLSRIAYLLRADVYLRDTYTACGHRIAHRKWKETKQDPGTAGPGNRLGCCLIYLHFLWAILCPQAVLVVHAVLFISNTVKFRLVLYLKVPIVLTSFVTCFVPYFFEDIGWFWAYFSVSFKVRWLKLKSQSRVT